MLDVVEVGDQPDVTKPGCENGLAGTGLVRCPNPDCPDVELFGVQGRYRDGVTECPKCGAELVADAPRASQPATVNPGVTEWTCVPDLASHHDSDRLAAVAAFNYRNEAELLATLLWARGFPAVVESDDCGSLHPELSLANEVFVSVRASDLDDVVDLMDSTLGDTESFDPSSQPIPEYVRFYRISRAFLVAGIFFYTVIFMSVALMVSLYGLRRLPSREDEEHGMASRRMLILVVSTAFFTFVSASGLVLRVLSS